LAYLLVVRLVAKMVGMMVLLMADCSVAKMVVLKVGSMADLSVAQLVECWADN
jgi:hypothetical protein